MKALIITADHFEDSALLVPYYRLRKAGIGVDIAPPNPAGSSASMATRWTPTRRWPASIRMSTPSWCCRVARRQRPCARSGRRSTSRAPSSRNAPVAAICHGPQTLVSAGLLRGRRATCYRAIAEELKNAGAHYEDCEVVVDGNLVTSRQPSDLPACL